MNLVQNAVEAVRDEPSGQVVVRVEAVRAGFVDITVEDNGPGVAKEFAARLFEPYATTKTAGTGLGLAIAQRIAMEHDGELSYLGGKKETRGAAFRFVLSIEGPDPVSEVSPAESAR
jgi:C4-dicarboxylate-specific signal transduction histidine kinase